MKARGYEDASKGFDTYYSFVEQVPDREPEDTPETSLITEDLKRCFPEALVSRSG